MTQSDPRFISLYSWLQRYFKQQITCELISGDASFRRYFRVTAENKTYIVADSPPNLLDNQLFISIARTFSANKVPVPKIITINESEGFILQEDLGNDILLSQLTLDNVKNWYIKALALLVPIGNISESEQGELPNYDAEFVLRELTIFTDWLVMQYCELSLTPAEQQLLDDAFSILVENVLAQPQVGMHRDFHSRNLMIKNDQLWVIDFQDAVLGPVTYDAVSLLRDCYIRWPDEIVDELRQHFYQTCILNERIDKDVSFTKFTRWFDLMGLQRHIKAAGIFARLHLRDNKSGYLKDIPLTLDYIVDISNEYPELHDFRNWLNNRLIPILSEKIQ